jgi:hypothetical protein
MGTGMEETYQVTSALKHLPFGKHVALITDARFSGVSTGACIGHVGPKHWPADNWQVRDGELSESSLIETGWKRALTLVGEGTKRFSPQEGERFWRRGHFARTWRLMRNCRMTRDFGRSCNTPAAGHGADVCLM